MINFLVAIALILFVAILFVFLWRAIVSPVVSTMGDVEYVTETTTTTTVETVRPTIDQLPELKREFNEAGQPFVKDPVDNALWFLNTNDDMYEDANGKWWRLV